MVTTAPYPIIVTPMPQNYAAPWKMHCAVPHSRGEALGGQARSENSFQESTTWFLYLSEMLECDGVIVSAI